MEFRIVEMLQERIKTVLADGVASRTPPGFNSRPIANQANEMKLFFHDAAVEAKVGEFEVLVDTPEGRKSLGVFNGSVGSDGSVATTIDFKFNILNPGPIKLYIRCITKGFVFNGF